MGSKDLYVSIMKEDLIAYIWKHQQLTDELESTGGETIRVINRGTQNSNAGPDFLNAQLVIANQKWAGNIEIHVKSSDWYVHGHETDSKYDNVILHVVWEHDAPVFRSNNILLTTLELSGFIDSSLLKNYGRLFAKNQKWINCENDLKSIERFSMAAWFERLYIERLEQKSTFILDLLQKSKSNWEAVLFQLLSKNFGLKVNGEAFFNIALNLDFHIIRKEANNLNNLEALFLGRAGLLQKHCESPYYSELNSIYRYLITKYQLNENMFVPVVFFRLRPHNFPTIRLAQLAAIYYQYNNLFSTIVDCMNLENYYELFDLSASSFWDTHYTFKTRSKNRKKRLTKSFINLLLINTIIPLLFLYQKSIGQNRTDEILQLITAIKPEQNSMVRKFHELGVPAENALTSQALLRLKNGYCDLDKCLHCSIGNKLLTK